jgi:hypothetical protein
MAGNLTAMIASIFSGSAVTPDPYFEYTTLLLPGNGTNGAQNNTFLDGSTNNFTITRNGNTTQGTFSPFSQTGWGNYFVRASSQYLTVSNSGGQFSFGTGAFTIECWVNPASLPSGTGYPASYWLFGGGPLNSNTGIDFYINSTQIGFSLVNFLTPTAIGNHGMSVGVWYHVAVVRGGGSNQTVSIYVNGSRVATATSVTATADAATSGISISAAEPSGSTSGNFDGYISNYRIVKGTAVYDPTLSTLTVPTTPLTAITNTQLLTCQSNRFIDSNTQTTAKTITVTGSPQVVAFSPFNPTSSWSAATNGGSGYFDGNNDYLSVPDNVAFTMGAGDFCIEAWVYITNNSGSQVVFGTCDSGGSQGSMSFVLQARNSSGFPNISVGYAGALYSATSSQALIPNQWTHLAGVRNGATVSIYVNGESRGTLNMGTLSITDSSQIVGIGRNGNGNFEYVTGYIAGARIVKGSSVYTGAFTPPIAPLSTSGAASASAYPSTTNVNTSFASSECSLLLNFTNAGIYDATSKNDLETLDNTVNGVRISTAQSQFGGSSILFDGTGTDYLWIQADQPIQRFGTGKFTIELWIRLAATGSARGLVAKGTSTTGWLVSLNTSNQVVFTYGTSTITSTGTISANVWTYIAVIREGTSTNQTKIYINGTNDGTGTVSTDFNQTNAMYLGANRTGGDLFSGYMQDVRITNGIARTITSTPTAAFPTL